MVLTLCNASRASNIKALPIKAYAQVIATHARTIGRGRGHIGWHPRAYAYQYLS